MSASTLFLSCQASLTFPVPFHTHSLPFPTTLIILPSHHLLHNQPPAQAPHQLPPSLLLFLLFFLFYNCKMKTFFGAQKWVICASEAFNTVGSSDVLKLPHNETTALGLINNKDAKRDFLLKMLTGREDLVPLQRMTYHILNEKANSSAQPAHKHS